MSIPTITIDGDRQAGKTRGALSVAVADALAGRRVIFTTGHQANATEAIRRAIGMMPPAAVTKVTVSAGNQRIATRIGGWIYFLTRRGGGGGRGCSADTLVLDEWDDNQRHRENLVPALLDSSDPRIVIAPLADR